MSAEAVRASESSAPPGRLWPLWLHPMVAVLVPGALLAVTLLGPPPTRARLGLGSAWLAFLAVVTLPAYLVAVLLLRQRLRRLTTRQVAFVAALATLAIPALTSLAWQLAARSPTVNDTVFLAAPMLAPLVALPLCWALVARVAVRRARSGDPDAMK